MKQLLVVLACLSLCSISIAQSRTWEKLPGPYGVMWVLDFKISPEGEYYVATFKDYNSRALLRSQDHGQTWTQINTPKFFDLWSNYPEIRLIDFTPKGEVIMLLGTGLYLSPNKGDTWKLLCDSVGGFLGYGKDDEFFMGTSHGIYRSTDAGQTWNSFKCADYSVTGAIYHLEGETYVACGTGDYYRITFDNGATWSFPGNSPSKLFQGYDALMKGPPGKLIMRTFNDVFIGDFKGAWEKIAVLPDDINEISMIGTNRIIGKHNYSEPMPSIFISEPGTTVMKRLPMYPDLVESVGQGLQHENQFSYFKFTSDNEGALVFAAYDGIYRSTDEGETWKELPIPYDDVSDVYITNGTNQIFTKRQGFRTPYPARRAYRGNLNVSKNLGKHWSEISPTGNRFWGYVGPGFDDGVIVSVEDTDYFTVPGCIRRMDLWYYGGVEAFGWRQLSSAIEPKSGQDPIAYFTLVDSANVTYLSQSGKLFRSDDRGLIWEEVTTLPTSADAGALSPSDKLYAVGNADGAYHPTLFMSDDGGTSWDKLNLKVPNTFVFSIIVPKENLIFVGTETKGLYRSEDNGATWTRLDFCGDSITSLAFSKNEIFIGTRTNGLFSCDYDGNNGVQEPLNVPSKHILSLFVHKNRDLYVGTAGSSLWVSRGVGSSVASDASDDSRYHAEIVNATTGNVTLRLTCHEPLLLRTELYDALGKQLRSFPDKHFTSGSYLVPLDMSQYPQGSYFVRLTSDVGDRTVKFVR